MINLLPPKEKDNLLLEEKEKIGITFLLLIIIFIISLAAVLFSINIYLKTEISSQKTIFSEDEFKTKQEEINDFEKKIDAANQTLSKLISFYNNKVYLTNILNKISGVLPQNCYLTNISFVSLIKEKEPMINISLSGFSPTRENLFNLKQNLEKEKDFKNINFPASDWTKSSNIDFIISFEIPIKK